MYGAPGGEGESWLSTISPPLKDSVPDLSMPEGSQRELNSLDMCLLPTGSKKRGIFLLQYSSL